ncbi:MAG: hypothetical protein MJ134_00205 [Lachnospiraceae bacterium]|nr:hypothetical protein [Lachnospiraceae bacterium]
MGIVGGTIYAAYFSIVYKVGMVAHLLFLCIAIICCLQNKSLWKQFLQKGKPILFSWEGFFYLCFILGVAYFTSRGNFHTDTNIYHAQNIRLYEEFGLIKGMGNLQYHYGYNSLYLAFAALMSLKWLLPWSLHTTTGFVEMVLCVYAFHHLKSFRLRTHHLEDAGCVAILVYALVNLCGSMSPATDYPTMFLSLYMIAGWLRAMEKKSHYSVYALLSVFSVFLSVMKLSSIAMAAVVVLPAFYLLKEKKWKEIAYYLGLGSLILLPYLVRNVLITGWLIYPVESLDLFSVEWKIPKEYLHVDAAQIRVWGKCLFDVSKEDWTVRQWFPLWIENKERYELMFLGCVILGGILSLGNLIYKWINKVQISVELVVLYIGIGASAVLWFIQAPFIRYGLSFLLAIPLIAMAGWYDLKKTGFYNLFSGILVFGIIVCFSPYMNQYVTDDGVFLKQRIKDPYYIVQKDYDDDHLTSEVNINGVTIYCAGDYEVNTYFYTPNTCYDIMLNRTTLKSNDLKDGFIPKIENK